MEDNHLQTTIKFLKGVSEGKLGKEMDTITNEGIQIIEARVAFLRCNFIITPQLADKDGNWQAGAIAALIDVVGALAVYSSVGNVQASFDLSVSFYSTAKIQEEVEIEAKVVGNNGRITSALVEIRRRDKGEVIALGKQWITSRI